MEHTKAETPHGESKMPVFTFGGIGVSSYGNLASLKGTKTPIFMKSKPG